MEITVCKNSGFCYGVKRADAMLNRLLDEGKTVCTLGPLAHNADYLAELSARGVTVVDDPAELPPGACLLVRSHGISAAAEQRLRASGVEWYDATCPSVRRIQDIAASLDPAGLFFFAGQAEHPEVVGILGRCTCTAFCFDSAERLSEILQENFPDGVRKEAVCAAQTTFPPAEWEKCKKILKNRCTNPQIFDTICNTTRLRQAEAEQTASVCDLVIVIGGSNSANTRKLYEACRALTRTVWIERARDLRGQQVGAKRVGIVAGASTPVKIIMEVVHKMDENKEILLENEEKTPEQETAPVTETPAETEAAPEAAPEEATSQEGKEFDFASALEASYKRLDRTDTVKGIVTGIYPTEVAVDIGRKQAGYIPLSELSNDPNAKPSDLVKIGDELTLIVMKTNDADGTVMMSKRRAEAGENWTTILAAADSGEVLEGTVTQSVGAGVIVNYEGVQVFVPASHTGIPREGDLTTLVHQKVKFVILEVEDKGRRKRAVGSIRKAAFAGRKEATEKFWETAKVGDVFEGRVRSVTDFGVFVNLGGPDGLVHRSELSWQRFKSPADLFKVGDEIKVYIKALDPEKKRISLAHRMPEDNPFNAFLQQYHVDDTVTVTVTSTVTYGAFAEIIPGVEGLIHISNLSDHKIDKVTDVVKKGDTIEARIIEINPDAQKISLSVRALLNEAKAAKLADEVASGEDTVVASIGDDTAPVVETAVETVVEETPAEETKPARKPRAKKTEEAAEAAEEPKAE